jgi:hypothetical protein
MTSAGLPSARQEGRPPQFFSLPKPARIEIGNLFREVA